MKGSFVSKSPPTTEHVCLSLFGKQTASVVRCIENNKSMFTSDTSEAEFFDWLKNYFKQ